MELQSIQEKLNTLLEGSERRVVFWYDEDAAYSEDIEALNINAKTVKLTGNNNFAVKLLLEHQDEENNYLVYAPFKRPEDKENFLADIFYYSKHFHSDKLTQLMGELNISAEYQDTVKKYKKFWTGGNFNKFKALDIDEFNNETIELGILCTLAGVKTLSFEEMLKKTILSGASENPVIKKLESQGIDNVFWKLCEKQYGYIDNEPSIEKFLLTMLVTYMDTVMNGAIPPVWKSFVSKRRNDAIVFIKNIMRNEEWRDFYYDFSKKAGKELNISGLIKDIPLEAAVLSDALCDFDEKIIAWIIEKLSDRTPDEKISGMSIPEICEKRCRSACHFSYLYKEKYQMLTAAYHVLKKISLQRYGAAVGEVLKDYTDNAYLIDTYYRRFYYLLDRTGMDVHMEKLRDLVENMYTNKYLTDSAYKWNMLLTDEAYKSFPGVRQKDFFEHYVSPFMNESGGGRVIVIISDGLRYECAKELLDNLETDEKCDARLEYMLSSLPSETILGMASLLPNKDVRVYENPDIFVDDMHCTNSTSERQRILQAVVKKSTCYEFDYVMQSKQNKLREMFQDKELVYIYQNQIDQRGESGRSDNEVFIACKEAIKEIQTMIRRLTGYVSATRYIITADHGFIYKRDRLPESDKIKIENINAGFKNKRYLLSNTRIDNEALICRSMKSLSRSNKAFVITPMGGDIIKMSGGGQNYVHGGSSLQEMTVPVIKVNTLRGRQDTQLVNVELSSFNRRITGIEVRLDFMQMEPVSDVVKPRRLQAFFVDENNNKISFTVPITADISSKNPGDRLIQEKFTLKSGRYKRSSEYFLVLSDIEDESLEISRYKFEIDISGDKFRV